MNEEEEYKASPYADIDGTSFHDHTVLACYEQLVEILGPHNCNGDGNKTTTMWVMEGPDGAVVTLYDWKATSAYDPSLEVSVEEIRDWVQYRWHVGSKSNIESLLFKIWLDTKLGNEPEPQCSRDCRYCTYCDKES